MKTSLKVFAIIAIVLGGFAILGSATEPTFEDAIYAFIGGGLFLAHGILSLAYIKQTSK